MKPAGTNPVSLDARAVAQEAQLEIRARDGQITRVPLRGTRFVIGRLPDADIRIPHDTVSRRHAELVKDPFGRWWLRDLGSRYGMRQRGQPVSEVLLGGDEDVEVGEFHLRLETSGAALNRSDLSMPSSLLRDDRGGSLQTLRDAPSQAIAPDQLAQLTRLGHELSRESNSARRIQMLCEHFAERDFLGLAAMVLRVPLTPSAPPQKLCGTRNKRAGQMADYVSRTLLREVLRLREPVLASNMPGAAADLDLSLPAAELEMAAVACPLRDGSQTLDVLYVTLPPQLGNTSFLALAALAAALFQQAETGWQLHANLQAYELIERDLVRGREIQQRLLPSAKAIAGLDVAFGMQPCRWVGGDYVDVIPLPDGRVLLLLGDVSGKGLSAALTTGNLHALIHARATGQFDLSGIVSGANDYLAQVLPDDAFVTLCGVLLDPRTGGLEIGNAGHPLPLIVDPTGGVRELPAPVEMPLGMQTKVLGVQAGQLDHGQWLVLYSDGATDLVNEQSQRLEFDGLREIIHQTGEQTGLQTARQFVEHLEERLNAFQGRSLPADDRTLLVARRT